MQEVAATWCRPKKFLIAADSIEEIAYSVLRKNSSFSPPNNQFHIAVKGVEGKTLIQPIISIQGSDDVPDKELHASEAEIQTDWQARKLYICCRNVDVYIKGQISYHDPSVVRQSVPIIDPGRPEHHRDWMAMYEIPDHINQLSGEAATIEQRLAALATIDQSISNDEKNRLNERLGECKWLIYRLRTEPYRRLSNGFTCLCFVLIGIPVAMMWRHADILTNFFVCFVPILAIYYPLMMFGDDLTTSGRLHPIFYWMGNTALVVPGILLLRRMMKH
jgi:lipopolysaccharide export system permease protein